MLGNLIDPMVDTGYALKSAGKKHSSGDKKGRMVKVFPQRSPVILCSESGGEDRNLQFTNMLINFDLLWNPMRIE